MDCIIYLSKKIEILTICILYCILDKMPCLEMNQLTTKQMKTTLCEGRWKRVLFSKKCDRWNLQKEHVPKNWECNHYRADQVAFFIATFDKTFSLNRCPPYTWNRQSGSDFTSLIRKNLGNEEIEDVPATMFKSMNEYCWEEEEAGEIEDGEDPVEADDEEEGEIEDGEDPVEAADDEEEGEIADGGNPVFDVYYDLNGMVIQVAGSETTISRDTLSEKLWGAYCPFGCESHNYWCEFFGDDPVIIEFIGVEKEEESEELILDAFFEMMV